MRLRLILLLLSFAVLSTLHAIYVPMFEGPDEPGNLQYLDFVATEGRLVEPTTELSHELETLGRGIMPPLWFVTHLPLYHALGLDAFEATPVLNTEFLRHADAIASYAARDLTLDQALAEPNSRLHYLHGMDEGAAPNSAIRALIGLRLAGVFWGVLALYWSFRALCLVLDCERRAFWFTALLAWTPQLQFISANINMDAMLAAAGALFFYLTMLWLRAEPGARATGYAVGAGLLVGVAASIKLNGLVLGAPFLMAFGLRMRALNPGRSVAHREGAWAALACGLALAPYYLTGWLQSGHPLWMWAYQKISPLHHPASQVESVWDATGIWNYHSGLFLTWFADIGWASVWFTLGITLAVMAVFAVGGALGLWLLRRAWRESNPGAALFLGAFVAIFGAELYFNLSIPQPQGRHLYPFLPVILFPLGLGLERLRALRPFALVCLALSVLAFPMLVSRLRPADWNARAWVAVTDQGRLPARAEPAEGERVEWLSEFDPATGQLAWRARPDHTYELLLGINNPAFQERPWNPGQQLLRSSVTFGVPLAGGALLPASFWEGLALGTELTFQVVEINSNGRMSGFSDRLQVTR